MDIQILHLIEGAKLARGITVIFDVFRAFSVEAYLFERGAECIIPVGDKEFAYKLKKENPKFLLVGERHGKIFPGFDMGNEEDFYMCTKTDCFDFVLKLKKPEHEVPFMIKEKV